MSIKMMVLLAGLVPFFFTGCGCLHRGPEAKANWAVKRISSKLDLNKEQKAKLESIKNEILAKRQGWQAQGKSLKTDLVAQIRSDKIDQAKVRELVGENASKREMREFFIAKFAEFHAVLNPEQREKLAKIFDRFAMPGAGRIGGGGKCCK